ncbi:MAG: HYR domain-containing protein [Bacteroidota bacterium]
MTRILHLLSNLPQNGRRLSLLLAFVGFLVGLKAQTVADFRIDSVGDNRFQVSMVTNVTYGNPSNRVNGLQIVVKVRTGGFVVTNLTNLINTGTANEVTFSNNSRNNAPIESPQHDYLSFSLVDVGTTDIPFVAGQTVPLFSFQNGGICSADSLTIMRADDPFTPVNSANANTQNQLTVLGFGAADAPTGIVGGTVSDCLENCVAEYEIDKTPSGVFRVSMTPRITYTNGDNRINSLQVMVRVRTSGFVPGNIINTINTGMPNEVQFAQNGRTNAPAENPNFDYISFNLQSIGTTEIPFIQDQRVTLFTFENVGLCTEDTVSLITPSDPFSSPNSSLVNADQQLTVLGFGTSDAPICVSGNVGLDCTRECVMGCNDNVQVSLGINCVAEVLPEMVATALNLTCPNGPKGIEILENGVPIPSSPFVNQSHIGRTLEVRVIDSLTTNSCWGSIIVKDKTPPVISCGSDTINCATQDISPNNPLLGFPMAIDNCFDTVVSLTYTDRPFRNDCGTPFSGRIERTWQAIDSAGMVGTCVQNIYFERQDTADVLFPENRDGVEGPVVTCTDGGGADPANTGSPTVNGQPIYPNILGFCQLDASYRDDTVSFCEGNLNILRRWDVVDVCNAAYLQDIQLIIVRDTTPPEITCPDTIRATVNATDCSSTVTFPAATVTDQCSGARVSIQTPFGVVNGNGGSLNWIPRGFHPITYTAIDSCGNQSVCSAILHVSDRTAPVAACDFINDVSLRADGTVQMRAEAFDDDSRDGCSGDNLTFLVQRVGDTLDFAPFVTFRCEDAGDTVNVNLRVIDEDGNTDDCVAAIVITGNTPPQITCPPDQTIQCTQDYSDLSIFGMPTVIDDCGGTTGFTEQDSFSLNGCGVGQIFRTFTANNGASSSSCRQIITVENNTVFDGTTIVWPSNYTAFACTDVSLHPDSLPVGFNVPTYDSTGSLCSRILRYYNDRFFDDRTDTMGCYTILRQWAIIDWCTFDPTDTLAGGYWTQEQRIDLVNSVAPTFDNCPSDFTVAATIGSCGAVVPLAVTASDDCTPLGDLRFGYSIDIYNDGIRDSIGTTNDATATYPVGTHRATFTVTDDCTNSSTCDFLFTVQDLVGPTLVCQTDTFNIEDIGDELVANVIPNRLVSSVSDNCNTAAEISITVTPSSFRCNQLGLNRVMVRATDLSGNADSCMVDVFISDRDNRCPTNQRAVNISGIIADEMGARVEQVEVSINHPDVKPAMTNANGEFMLRDVPIGNDYTLLPVRDFDLLNGISTFDLVLISRHILNIEKIKSPYRLIAADVNRSGTITAYDIVQLRRLILRLSTNFPNNDSWRFVRTDFEFSNVEDPQRDYFPEVYNINDLPRGNMEIEGFVAIKIGDVNNSASTQNTFVEGEERSATQSLQLTTEQQELKIGTIVNVPIRVDNYHELLGFQFAVDFDPSVLAFSKIISNATTSIGEGNIGTSYTNGGLLTVSWERPTINDLTTTNTELFTLQFKVKQATNLAEVLRLAPDFMKSEAYRQSANDEIELLDVRLKVSRSLAERKFTLYQNRPNPFNGKSIIGFDLTKNETVDFRVLDIAGKVLLEKEILGVAGPNELTIHKKELNGAGVYYYQVATETELLTKKMILLD